jgi:hypothetical protein
MRRLATHMTSFIPYPWKKPLSDRVCTETDASLWYRLVHEIIFVTGVQIGTAYHGRNPDRFSEWGRLRI